VYTHYFRHAPARLRIDANLFDLARGYAAVCLLRPLSCPLKAQQGLGVKLGWECGGTAGCIVHFITSADYTYGYTRGWQIVRTKSDQPIILLELHGLSCGEVGTTPCYDIISIFEGRFIVTAK
jgi:hypothetical protein